MNCQMRRIKSEAKVSMKAELIDVVVSAPAATVDLIQAAAGDLVSAGRVNGAIELRVADGPIVVSAGLAAS